MKTAIITGGNGGLGRELIKRFATLGYSIFTTFRSNEEDFKKYCEEIEKKEEIEVKAVKVDFGDNASLQNFLNFVENDIEEVDLLINCAAINIIKPLFNIEYSDLLQSFQINYFTPVLLSKTVSAKMMMQGYGNIINISSITSMWHQTGGSCYDASKAALNQFTVTSSQELAPFNIRVNAIAPGAFQAPMYNNLSDKNQKNLIKHTAMKRAGELCEIVDLVEFLASDKSAYITGQVIKIDGGSTI